VPDPLAIRHVLAAFYASQLSRETLDLVYSLCLELEAALLDPDRSTFAELYCGLFNRLFAHHKQFLLWPYARKLQAAVIGTSRREVELVGLFEPGWPIEYRMKTWLHRFYGFDFTFLIGLQSRLEGFHTLPEYVRTRWLDVFDLSGLSLVSPFTVARIQADLLYSEYDVAFPVDAIEPVVGGSYDKIYEELIGYILNRGFGLYDEVPGAD